MALPNLFRGSRGRDVPGRRDEHPFSYLQRDMNRLFKDFWRGDLSAFDEGWSRFDPHVDVEETDGEIRVTAELPGLDQKDFEVSLADEDTLVLRGEKRAEREDDKHGWRERTYGRFERMLSLPSEVDADKVSAQFTNGVLTIRLPKSSTARQRSKRIPITAS